jgi:hypothetical protein
MQTNPSNDISTMRDLENRVDTLRGQITLQEQSILSNKKVLSSQEYTIGQNSLKIAEQDSFIITREATQNTLTKDIEVLESEKESLVIENGKIKITQTNVKADIEASLNEMAQKEVVLQDKIDNVDSRGNAVTIRELAVEEKEKAIAGKHTAIKELASKL